MSDAGGDVRGNNLYSYCFNNPVNITDEDGYWPQWAKNVAQVVAGVAIIGTLAAATVLTGGAVAVVAGAALSGVLVGGEIGAVSGAVIRGITRGWEGAIDGAYNGFLFGVATGAVTSGAMAGANTASGATIIIGKEHPSVLHILATNMKAGQMAASSRCSQIAMNRALKTIKDYGSK